MTERKTGVLGGAAAAADAAGGGLGAGVTAVVLAALIYGASIVLLLALLSFLVDADLSRDRFWKYMLYWAVFQLPLVWTLPLAALLSKTFWQRRRPRAVRRAIVVALTLASLALLLVLGIMYMAASGGRGVVLLLLLAVMLYAGWRSMRMLMLSPAQQHDGKDPYR